jgi:23S rRNA (cytidine1920-2'-O)/16S rRNA (cytidine1409-2'-O)-methyltransferase
MKLSFRYRRYRHHIHFVKLQNLLPGEKFATLINLMASIFPYVSRAGQKLAHAIQTFSINPAQFICADLGCSTGGFTDCLLQHGAAKVYAVDTGYGVLDWKLRKDPRVVVMERINAMHVQLPELVDLVSIDVAWTRQKNILPAARKLLKPEGIVISLIKPHYEAPANLLRKGILDTAEIPGILAAVTDDIQAAGFELVQTVESPIKGSKGNTEVLAFLGIKDWANVQRSTLNVQLSKEEDGSGTG